MDERRQDYPDILTKIDSIKTVIDKANLPKMSTDIDAINKIMNGNGKLGLVAKVENLLLGAKGLWTISVVIIGKLIYDWVKNH